MQTHIADFIRDTPEGGEADAILRSCVHCGFCLATCPTYQLLGDELDSPRGRIYLIKQLLEGGVVTEKTQLHLDRCLTCRACETTCPSGVKYGRLLDIGRNLVEKAVGRDLTASLQRAALRQVLPRPARFEPLLKLGQTVRSFLPEVLRNHIPEAQPETSWPAPRHSRKMLQLECCVQPGLAPNINAATARVLDRLGISLVRALQAGCCGAMSYHLNAQEEGLDYMRRLIDAWWPHAESGVEAIVTTASGCGAMIKEYGHLLRHDASYAEKAKRISALTRDVCEILANEQDALVKLLDRNPPEKKSRLAFHAPCTLQHGQKIHGVTEQLLQRAGFELAAVPDAHLCCGSAGTYSIFQKELSGQLLRGKVQALESGKPEKIVTANIGCLVHLQKGTALPVQHWIEIIDSVLGVCP